MAKKYRTHYRNVAGYKLRQIGRAVYEQTLPDGKLRWFVRLRVKGTKKDFWRYTKTFNEGETPQNVSRKFDTLTDAVIAANK